MSVYEKSLLTLHHLFQRRVVPDLNNKIKEIIKGPASLVENMTTYFPKYFKSPAFIKLKYYITNDREN